QQRRVIAAGQIARELFTIAVVLGRASGAGVGHRDQQLAAVYCAGAMARLPALWPELTDDTAARDAEIEAVLEADPVVDLHHDDVLAGRAG
ncbi:MAG TPA: hypothetical protein VF516_01800, partial [Kofleriaceae bacterium]